MSACFLYTLKCLLRKHFFREGNSMLIFFNTDPETPVGKQLQSELARAVGENEIEIHVRQTSLAVRLRRRIYDVDMIVCVVVDIPALREIEQLSDTLQDIDLVLVVSPEAGRQTARLYRLYPRSVLLLGDETSWIVDFVYNKMCHLKKGGV